MSFKMADRVLQTSTTTGTGPLSLDPSPPGMDSFVSGIGDGNTTGFLIVDAAGNYEINIGTVTAGSGGPDTISRGATPIKSSNSGALVDFDNAQKTVVCIPIAELAIYFATVPTYDDDQIPQRKAGNWVVRTMAQLAADLITAVGFMKSSNNLSEVEDPKASRASISAAKVFVQSGDPDSAAQDGDIWIQI